MTLDSIPHELKTLPQWVVRKGKTPFNPINGSPAKAGQPGTWSSFDNAAFTVDLYDGLGFEFADGGGIVGIDLDTVRDPKTGYIAPEAADIIRTLDSYTEISPSGYGFHIYIHADPGLRLPWHRASLPANGIERVETNRRTGKAVRKEPEIEVYNDKRYFTFTGNRYGDRQTLEERGAELIALIQFYGKHTEAPAEAAPQSPRSDAPLPEALRDYLSIGLDKDAKFRSLWNGNRPQGNESGDDQALMNKLAYWCGKDEAAMIAAFTASPHCQSKDAAHLKKAQRADYLSRTAKRAIRDCTGTAAETDAQYQAERIRQDFSPQENKDDEKKPLKFRRMSEIKPKRPNYLIFPYFPRGKLTIIGGVSGSTKTWFTLELSAVISKGRRFFSDDDDASARDPGIVIYQTKENDYESDVRPRLDKLDANLDNIIVLDDYDEDENGFPLTLSDGRIEQAMQELHPALLIFDPIQSYLGAETDMNQANKVRPIMDKLIDIAARYDCALVLISHMSKKTDLGALDRLLGSSDLRNAARSIIIIGSDPDDPETRILAHAKNSLGQPGRSLKYHIDRDFGVVFDGYSDLEADDIIPKGVKKSRDGRKEKPADTLEEAVNALSELIGEDGYCTTEQAETLRLASGYSERTMRRAKKELELETVRIGFGDKMVVYWLAPDVDRDAFRQDHTPLPEQTVLS